MIVGNQLRELRERRKVMIVGNRIRKLLEAMSEHDRSTVLFMATHFAKKARRLSKKSA